MALLRSQEEHRSVSDCSHEWGLDLLGYCKGCGEFCTDDPPKPRSHISTADVHLPFDPTDYAGYDE